jgi:hypothetical protein
VSDTSIEAAASARGLHRRIGLHADEVDNRDLLQSRIATEIITDWYLGGAGILASVEAAERIPFMPRRTDDFVSRVMETTQ